ncbi:hypothetical protein VLK81_06730 [Citroniella saccharovorans]|uniref:Uncharacterized protein n=1 Tax=Citroniella saccharovorans TaxID=2053367 RepID=A0AAW9MVA9_9FIRM|nr:hypothetical protein [Citroniella saccharovorans]MEB3429708.1 hypothetical protein [Citroniella saccharovorans]
MVNVEVMKKSKNRFVNIYFTDGDNWKNIRCTNFYLKDDGDEENMLEFENVLINQSEIKKIEILD